MKLKVKKGLKTYQLPSEQSNGRWQALHLFFVSSSDFRPTLWEENGFENQKNSSTNRSQHLLITIRTLKQMFYFLNKAAFRCSNLSLPFSRNKLK